ncbi:hypothetical protein N0V93_003599 [Gnomoniopsis smithogilvyi]|uniref:Uncharacterized protein n=1 Tax=Gnomoniopsis smithogilvyi TaxID=1191159 RepID=A0A9W8YXE9_9PEZI|nr:hypothetical protein N0V93_003599 [Gnomoniopsis smithogilvyi]
MSYQDELSSIAVDEQLSEALSDLDVTPTPAMGTQALTVYSPTVVSTVFVPENSVQATAISSSAPLSISSSTSSASNSSNSGSNSNSNQSSGGDRPTVIVLATVMSVVGCLLIALGIWALVRCRRRRSKLFTRGITPIDDDEIETWKGQRTEKGHDMEDGPHSSPQERRMEDKGHQKSESTTSIKKPPSVIVYARKSEEWSPRSPTMPDYPFSKMSLDGGKRSFEKELPMSPIQARAPNAREGLTDEAIPGDEPFVSSPKRRGSRLSKGPRYSHQTHSRTKSNRSSSSLHRLGDRFFGYESDDYRPSHEYYPGHSRVSSSQEPPRLSLSEDWPAGYGGLSPRPVLVRAEDIGRAIG